MSEPLDPELESVARRLDAAARLEAEELREAAGLGSVAGSERVDETLERLWSADARPRGAHRRKWLLAAGLLVAASFGGYFLRGGPPRREVLLGGEGVECLAPLGGSVSFGSFEWRSSLPPGGRYEITVWREAEGRRGEACAGPLRLTEAKWNPSAEQLRALGDEVQWQVRVLDATGAEVASGTARAWRSR